MPDPKDIPAEQAVKARKALRKAEKAIARALKELRPPRGIRDPGGD